jgi:hypothetical protein
MAAAKALGASQRQIAKAVGMSSTWVHQMLKWRAEDYKDITPFGPQSKANRQRAKVGQAADRKKTADRSDAGTDQAQAAAAGAAKTAKAEAAKAKANAAKAAADARRARAEALVEQSLAEILPGGIWPIEPDSISLLKFNDAGASHAPRRAARGVGPPKGDVAGSTAVTIRRRVDRPGLHPIIHPAANR